MSPIILTSLSSSGTAKTTNFAHIGHYLAVNGYRVKIIELDNRNSLTACCGIESRPPELSTATIFNPNFTGRYPFAEVWRGYRSNGLLEVLLAERRSQVTIERALNSSEEARWGNPSMGKSHFDNKGIFSLSRLFKKHPIDCDILILDCPGQQSTLTDAAIVASTHILIGIEPTRKCFEDAAFFLEHLYSIFQDIDRVPELLGFLPGKFNLESSYQREGIKQLYDQAQLLAIELFNPIRFSPYFETAYDRGCPISAVAPSFAGVKDYLIEGNFFRRSHKGVGLFDNRFKKLPAIVPYLEKIINNV